MTILERFADPNLLAQMTASEKLTAALITTVLGMGITFMALIILWGLIIVMGKVLNPAKKKEAIAVVQQPEPAKASTPAEETAEEGVSGEVVAVIAAAIAASLNTSIHNIVVRNIVRVPDASPAWNNAGRQEQMNTRF